MKLLRCLFCHQWWATNTHPITAVTCRFCPDCIPHITTIDTPPKAAA